MLEEQLQTHFGFNSFKKGQKEVISAILNDQSAAAIFPTGSGKSLCYQLPAMVLPGITLVVSPLLSLMKDQLDFLLEHNIPAARLDSSLEREDYNRVLEKAKNKEIKILMISVERFKNERFRSHLQRMDISLLVIDEAHCISEWGHNFRPEYLKLPAYRETFGIKQTLLLTATATEQVIEDMRQKFNILNENVVITGFYRKNLFLQVTPTRASEKMDALLKRIQNDTKASTIVYVTLQKTAEEVSKFLCENSINAQFYHAGMKTEEREQIQNQFMEGKVSCIVATIAFGMGIDKKDVRRVIHYDLPKSIENYSQEIGRSGRDGNSSLCEVLASGDNLNIFENFIYGDTPEKISIFKLLQNIQTNPGPLWEIKLISLSNDLNIRALPLKTLLVYLDMEGIIHPKWTYFDEYSFKSNMDPLDIISNFQGERNQFVTAIFNHCHKKLTWTTVDIQGILDNYQTDRQRIITALEYFEEKGWLELQSKQSVDAYEISNQDFNIDDVTERLYSLFKTKEANEIQRIHNMVGFFESDSCLSKGLARYFGENIKADSCGHCSHCKNGRITLQKARELKPIASFNLENISNQFVQVMGTHFTDVNLVKFLCGIYTPIFIKLKIRKLPHFGILEDYPFLHVKSWIEENKT